MAKGPTRGGGPDAGVICRSREKRGAGVLVICRIVTDGPEG